VAAIPVQGIDLWVLLFLTPIFRNSTRIATIKSERKFRNLQKFLLRRLRPSWVSFLSDGQAFNIRSTDLWWKPCVLTLLQSSDIIVVDLSKVKSGTAWELHQIKSRGLIAKCLFVVADVHQSDLKSILDEHFAEMPLDVHVYKESGILNDPPVFLAKLASAVDSALTDRATRGFPPEPGSPRFLPGREWPGNQVAAEQRTRLTA
jgi:hypothetical protein